MCTNLSEARFPRFCFIKLFIIRTQKEFLCHHPKQLPASLISILGFAAVKLAGIFAINVFLFLVNWKLQASLVQLAINLVKRTTAF
jgi:hypothetical protein